MSQRKKSHGRCVSSGTFRRFTQFKCEQQSFEMDCHHIGNVISLNFSAGILKILLNVDRMYDRIIAVRLRRCRIKAPSTLIRRDIRANAMTVVDLDLILYGDVAL